MSRDSRTVLGQCEACGCKRRRLARKIPCQVLDVSREQTFVWLCGGCGRMNDAILFGKAIVCGGAERAATKGDD